MQVKYDDDATGPQDNCVWKAVVYGEYVHV